MKIGKIKLIEITPYINNAKEHPELDLEKEPFSKHYHLKYYHFITVYRLNRQVSIDFISLDT
ncbi:MAG: hypothetical protein MJH09_12335 [Cetobacterium sp.]|nr:hypothetical protein [Cetobacterium sp.]